MVFYGAANRDERKFKDPYRFDVSRSTAEQLAFGIGAHDSVGQHLAKVEMSAIFCALAARVKRFRFEEEVRSVHNVFHGFRKLVVSFRMTDVNDEAGAGATPPLRCRLPTRVRCLRDTYCAGRNPTVVCGHADEEQCVGTRRDTSQIPDELSITFWAERNRCRVQDSLSRCAGVTHQRAFHACYRAWRAARVPAIQDESLDIEGDPACLEVHAGITLSGCPRQSATGNPGYGI
jgi:hypothetical protein